MDAAAANTIRESPPINIPDEQSAYPLESFHYPAHYRGHLSSVLIPHGLILDRVRRMAHDIAQDTKGPLVVCCVLKGALPFHNDLVAGLKAEFSGLGTSIPMDFEFIKARSYENDASTGSVAINLSSKDLAAFRGKGTHLLAC
jgi:hypoxanthine phosphoribosyltransferase